MTTKYVYTGITATAEEEAAMSTTIAVFAWLSPDVQKKIHACALSHALPEIPGFYGYDFTQHQFIRMPFEDLE